MNPQRRDKMGLQVDGALADFIDNEALPGSGVDPDVFWQSLADLVHEMGPKNRALLERRDRLQGLIDEWHGAHPVFDQPAYTSYLEEIGYLLPEGEPFHIDTPGVDPEIAELSGPQLVVPLSNARYALNAANARWGSLYDAVYGTDVLGDRPGPGGYDPERGAKVVAWSRRFLDDVVPLSRGSHADATAYRVADSQLVVETPQGSTGLARPDGFVGYQGSEAEPSSILVRNNGLSIDIRVDRDHPVGRADSAGVADIVMEAAVTVIMDCEDSVAAVDGADKAAVYRNWLGLVKGDLAHDMTKGETTFTRKLNPPRSYRSPTGGEFSLPSQGLMLVRNVGLLMTNPAVLDRDGNEAYEGLLDDMITTLCALHGRSDPGLPPTSSFGSIYVVKPKLHGPQEVGFVDEVLSRVEDALGLDRNTIKLGLMDEERRTTLNLKQAIRAAKSRIAFINTGFLDRTGDEIHTSMAAGPMIRKAEMKTAHWMRSYEDWNVDIGLECGLAGRAQIGKGMWAAPDLMATMLEEKIGHPQAGASCAWVPSPTAATLHATHYHRVDVRERQDALTGNRRAAREDLLRIPLAPSTDWTADERRAEIENNAQGILGYVVRWIDQGVGCSKVPDINDIALMEDRATCRISSQHIANWMAHGIVSEGEVLDTMKRMAAVVDRQNASDPGYTRMGPAFIGPAYRAAVELVIEGTVQPSGYTEPILHRWRRTLKGSTPGRDT